MIRRFDEVISNKVNKETFDHNRIYNDKTFEPQEKVKKVTKEFRERIESLEEFERTQK